MEEVLPEIVSDNIQPAELDSKTQKQTAKEIHFKGLNYTELIPVLISAMQEQNKTIALLKKQIQALTVKSK